MMGRRLLIGLPTRRDLCLEFPEVSERLNHGEPSWTVRKTFRGLTKTISFVRVTEATPFTEAEMARFTPSAAPATAAS